jgi:hypothetical protein
MIKPLGKSSDERMQDEMYNAIARHYSLNVGLNFNHSNMLINHNSISLLPRYRYYPDIINHGVEFNFFGSTPKMIYRCEKYSQENNGFGIYGQVSVGRDKYLPSEMYSIGAGVFFGLRNILKVENNLADIIERQRENITLRCGFETDHLQLREVGCAIEKHFGFVKIAGKLSANNTGANRFIPRFGLQITHTINC